MRSYDLGWFGWIVCGAGVAACTARSGGVEATAETTVAIEQAPSDALCLRITVSGSRTSTSSFDLSPGQTTVFPLTNLPVGSVVFTAQAYPSACTLLGSSAPDYAADPLTAVLRAGKNPGVTLFMHAEGTTTVSVDFPGADASTCNAGGGICSTPAQCCSQLCDLTKGPGDGTGICGGMAALEGSLSTFPSALKATDFRLSPPEVTAVVANPGPDGGTSLRIDFAMDPRLSAMNELVLDVDEGSIVLERSTDKVATATKGSLSFTTTVAEPFSDVVAGQQALIAAAAAQQITNVPSFVGREIADQVTLPTTASQANLPIIIHPPSLLPPSQTLTITDLSVVEDPTRTFNPCTGTGTPMGAWTFGRLMADMAGSMDPSVFVQNWVETWLSPQVTENGVTVQPRPGATALLSEWPTLPGGGLDISRAPFKLLAIVNRIDLAGNSSYGAVSGAEGRFVFEALNLTDCSPTDFSTEGPAMTIFEYGVPANTCSALRTWAQGWEALGTIALGSAAFNPALQALTDQFAAPGANPAKINGSAIDRVRTDEVAFSRMIDFWELREFHLEVQSGDPLARLYVETTAQTPDPSYNAAFPGTPASGPALLAQWLNGTAEPFTVPDALPFSPFSPFLAGRVFNVVPDWWSAPGVANPILHELSLGTCDGCHGRETGTPFTQITPVPFGTEALLSDFLTGAGQPVNDPRGTGDTYTYGDLALRAQVLQDFADSFCGLFPVPHPMLPVPIVFPNPFPPLGVRPHLLAE